MNQQDDAKRNAQADAGSEDRETGVEDSRADERGNAAEPDAPTSAEENVGMSTILNADDGTGVQADADDE